MAGRGPGRSACTGRPRRSASWLARSSAESWCSSPAGERSSSSTFRSGSWRRPSRHGCSQTRAARQKAAGWTPRGAFLITAAMAALVYRRLASRRFGLALPGDPRRAGPLHRQHRRLRRRRAAPPRSAAARRDHQAARAAYRHRAERAARPVERRRDADALAVLPAGPEGLAADDRPGDRTAGNRRLHRGGVRRQDGEPDRHPARADRHRRDGSSRIRHPHPAPGRPATTARCWPR